ncbi:hypothetical protein WDU94_012125 [Cyamophila willieti]
MQARNKSFILPGYSFDFTRRTFFGKKQHMTITNGHILVKRDFSLIKPEDMEPVEIKFDPLLTYGILKKPSIEPFIPNYVKYDNMRLVFRGVIIPTNANDNVEDDCGKNITVHENYDKDTEGKETNDEQEDKRDEQENKREIVLIYFLDDDTVRINEKKYNTEFYDILKKRSKLCKKNDDRDNFRSWREMNVGMDLEVRHLKIHLTACNEFTRQFYKDNNIHINEDEIPFSRDEEVIEKLNMKVSLDGEEIYC